MKRRDFLHSLAVAPAVAVPGLQQPAPAPPTAPPGTPAPAPQPAPPPPSTAVPVLETAPADVVATSVPTFFTPPQFAALTRLSDVLFPSSDGAPGALAADVPAFLDFLIGKAPDDRQTLYRAGLDALQSQARQQFGKAYEEVSGEQAESLLAPLRQPWTFTPPADPLAAFLRAAKQDVRLATQNSKVASEAASATAGRRGGGGGGLYWYEVV